MYLLKIVNFHTYVNLPESARFSTFLLDFLVSFGCGREFQDVDAPAAINVPLCHDFFDTSPKPRLSGDEDYPMPARAPEDLTHQGECPSK